MNLEKKPVNSLFPKPKLTWSDYIPLLCVIAAGITVIVTLTMVVGENPGKNFIKDDGLVQISGLCLISLASLICIFFSIVSGEKSLSYLMGAYALLIYAMREADLHKVLSPESNATKLKFYLHPDIGIGPKIIGISFLSLFAICVIILAYMYGKLFFNKLLQLDKRAIYLAVWAVIFALSQLLDKIHVSDNFFVWHTLEEVFEAMAEAIMLIFVILMFPRKKTE
jgi:hypothetical protein